MKYTDLENAIKIYNNIVCNRLKQKNKELTFGVIENSFTKKRITSNIDYKKDDLFKRFSIEELAKTDLEENEELLITNFCRDFDDLKSPFSEITIQEDLTIPKNKRKSFFETGTIVFCSKFGKLIKIEDELYIHPKSFKKLVKEEESYLLNKFNVREVKDGTSYFFQNLRRIMKKEKEALKEFIESEITAKIIFKLVKDKLRTKEFIKSATSYYLNYKNCDSIINLLDDYEKIIEFKKYKELKMLEVENAYRVD